MLMWEHYKQSDAFAYLGELITNNKVIILRNQELIVDMSNELSEAKRKIKHLESILDSDC